jgi:hypothetical protein
MKSEEAVGRRQWAVTTSVSVLSAAFCLLYFIPLPSSLILSFIPALQ